MGSKRNGRDDEMSDESAQMEAQSETAEDDENSSAEETSAARKKVHSHELVSFFYCSADRRPSPSIFAVEKWKILAIFPHA
jgi:hypothetical protein